VTTATAPRLTPTQDYNAYKRWVRRQKGYGRWQPFIDAEPVRTHVRTVMAATGIGWRRYADLAGVPRTSLTYLLYGRQGQLPERINPDNAAKLLAVHADGASGITIPAIGAHRRIQALAAEGWPQIHLAPVIGTHRAYVSHILTADRITAATADRVSGAYEQLRGASPLDHGVSAHGVLLARGMASRNRWLDRGYWDDVDRIDDPGYDPEAEAPRAREIAEDARWLMEVGGLTKAQVAARLGRSHAYINDALSEHPADGEAAA
jgi:hypothetical protein